MARNGKHNGSSTQLWCAKCHLGAKPDGTSGKCNCGMPIQRVKIPPRAMEVMASSIR